MRSMLGLLLTFAVVCGAADARAAEAPAALVVVSDFANPPFSFWNEGSAEPQGLEPDVMREVAATLGRPIEWSRRPFRELLQAVTAHEGDVIAATLGITTERAKLVAFSRPYYATRIAVLVRSGPAEPKTLADLAGLRVGASRGTTCETALARSLPEAVAVLDREDKQEFDALLRAGRISAAVMDAPAAERVAREHPQTLRVLEEDLGDERYAFAVARDAKELLATLDRVLGALEAEGRLRELKQRHGLAP